MVLLFFIAAVACAVIAGTKLHPVAAVPFVLAALAIVWWDIKSRRLF